LLRRIFRVTVALVITLVVFDVGGVVACLVLDVAPLADKSSALVYAIWFVLGVFCGLFAYVYAGGRIADGGQFWYERDGATRTGTFVIAVTGPLLLVLCGICYAVAWSSSPLGEYFVPDSEPLTLTFFGALFVSMLLMRNLFKPAPAK
jgi:hypothetical protein